MSPLGAGCLSLDPRREGWAGDKTPVDGAGSDTSPDPGVPIPEMGKLRRWVSGPDPAQVHGLHCGGGHTRGSGFVPFCGAAPRRLGFARIMMNWLRVSQII